MSLAADLMGMALTAERSKVPAHFTTDEYTHLLALCLQHQITERVGTVSRQITQRCIDKLNAELLRRALS